MNKVMLIGNVGKEPEVRYVDHGVAVARISLATSERGYTLPNGTQVPGRTDWHTVLFWRRLAEVVEKYVHKGDKLYVEGRLRYTTYDDKKGGRYSMPEVWAENMEMLTPKSASGMGTAQDAVQAPASVQGLVSGQSQQASAQEPSASGQAGGGGLPF